MSSSWAVMAGACPELAEAGRSILLARGEGFGYLSTVRPDGGPRVHPVTVVFALDGLWVFLAPSPKQRDLERDDRFALNSFPAPEGLDEFHLTGRARREDDPAVRTEVIAAMVRPFSRPWSLFELRLETAMYAAYDRPHQWPPRLSHWRGRM